jgi:hypothetical protein
MSLSMSSFVIFKRTLTENQKKIIQRQFHLEIMLLLLSFCQNKISSKIKTIYQYSCKFIIDLYKSRLNYKIYQICLIEHDLRLGKKGVDFRRPVCLRGIKIISV